MVTWEAQSGGANWRLELDRELLLPGRVVAGRVTIRAARDIEARGLVVTLRAEEHWRHRVTTTDAKGHSTTRVVTSHADAIRVPVEIQTPVHIGAGETLDRPFELPVPPLGPATLEADDAGLDWTIQAKLDIPGGFDSSIERPVAVAQPTALLRAGVVHVGEFALYETADVADGSLTGSITLEPAPLVCGAPFAGSVRVQAPGSLRLQEIRAELHVHVKATVSGGESQEITAWEAQISPAIEFSGEQTFELAGTLPVTLLPTIELPHGRTDATFHVILARAWERDTHLVRDVALATTAEL